MKSLKGQFLLATPELTDPNFAQSVLLMIHHDESGAMGVIINRPMEINVAQASDQFSVDLSVEDLDALSEQPLHHGGPCETMLLVLYADGSIGSNELLPGLFVTTEKSDVEALLKDSGARTKFVVGYAGWTAGQLEGEFEAGSWKVAPATLDRVMNVDPGLWDHLQAELSLAQWVRPDAIPDDPSMN